VSLTIAVALAGTVGVRAQEAPPPAYLAVVSGQATLERGGEAEPAVPNMPFVVGDRLRTAAGRVEILFPDGSGLEVGEYSEVELVSPTRVRLIAGTMDHIERPVVDSRSASYLPPDLQTYGSTFDRDGSWQYDSPYGYVWYPTVALDWRPYSYGSWSPIHRYGWTWIGLDAWTWPTHHYGRWGYARNGWFWIPGRTWGAAWVSWSFTDDYVSWCPLGFDSRPVFALSAGSRRAWDNWVVPRRTFASRGYAHNYAHDYSVREGGQSSVASRQSPVVSRQSPVLSHQSPALSRQSTDDYRPRTEDSRLRTDDYRLRTDDRRLTTAHPVAVPRAIAPERVHMPPLSYRGREQPPANSGYTPMPLATPVLPAAVGGAVLPRVGSRDGQPTTNDRGPMTSDRGPMTNDRRPTTTDYRPPTTDSRHPQGAAAPSAAAPPGRVVPYERAAPSGGEPRPRAEARPAESHRRR